MEDLAVLIKNAQAGDKEAFEVLIRQNSALVHYIVRRFMNRGYEEEDLFQIGCMGLVKAVQKFDLSLQLQFSTYAVPLISGEIKRFLRDDGPIKVSRGIIKNRKLLLEVMERRRQDGQDSPSLQELSEATGLPREDILLALDSGMPVESLNAPVGIEEREKVELLRDDRDPYEELINRKLVEGLMRELEEPDRRLIYLRYFKNCTQSQTAKILDTNQVKISRREKKILESFRKYL